MSQAPDWNVPGATPSGQPTADQTLPLAGTAPVPGYDTLNMPNAPAPAGMPNMPMPPGMPGAPVPPGMYLDQESGLVLPMGTAIASPGRRIGAYFLGFLLSVICMILLGLPYLIWGAITWSKGQTPTQQLLSMRYWNPSTRTTATWGTMALGQIIGRIVNAIALFGIVSFFMMLFSREKRTIYDHICGCVVLHDPNSVLDPTRAPQVPQAPWAPTA